jgi:hypothetical protein
VSEAWQTAFVAVTVAIGDPVDEALASLGTAETDLSPRAAALVRGLRSSSREERARVLATALSEVALAVDGMALS